MTAGDRSPAPGQHAPGPAPSHGLWIGDRRTVLAAGASLAATGLAGAGLAACASAPAGGAAPRPARVIAAGRAADVYGLALREMARARGRTIGPEANRFRHVRALADARSRRVTTPNNDTLYSSAWLDLRRGAVELAYPAAGARYMSLAFLDMYSNNFLVLGPGETRGEGGVVRLVAPGGGRGPGAIEAPTPWVWAQARTLVSSPQDLPQAHRLQDGLAINAAAAAPPPAPVSDTSARAEMAAILKLLATEAPPRPGEARLRAGFARAGLTRAAIEADAGRLGAMLEEGVGLARRDIDARLAGARPVEGWIYPEPALGDFGTDYLYRASVAIWGLRRCRCVRRRISARSTSTPARLSRRARPMRCIFRPAAIRPPAPSGRSACMKSWTTVVFSSPTTPSTATPSAIERLV